MLYQIVGYAIHGKVLKSHRKTTDLKCQLQREMTEFAYLMGHILYQMIQIIFKKHKIVTDNSIIK